MRANKERMCAMQQARSGKWLAEKRAGEGERGHAQASIRDRALFGLSLDYTIAFVLNLSTDEYEIVFSQATNHAQVHDEIGTFADYVAKYANDFVVEDQRAEFCRSLNSATIAERFEQCSDYHFAFETVPNAAGLSHFQAHIIKEYDADGHFAFLGFRSVDEIVRRERFYQEKLEAANRDLAQQLDLITRALPGGVKISNDDESYSFRYVSEQFATMLGYDSPGELIEACGGTIVGLAHPDDVETGIADALAQYAVQDHYATTYRVRCKDGSYKYIEDRGQKSVLPDGTVEHWNLILDKNELMEKTIALESEKMANQSKSDFLSRMSHDMRTPLNGIVGLLDICAAHPDNRELVDSSREKARIAANHLLSLINDTLELSKLENKDVALYEEEFYAPKLIEELETIAQMRADAENIDLVFERCDEELRYPYLVGSPLYIQQIFLNLVTNAIKYNREGGSVHCRMRQRAGEDGNTAVATLEVRDTGIGMEPEFLRDIYKPFVQADNGARSTYKGTGLGMAIVKNLVDRMGGTIEIESELGKGTAISVSMPFKIAEGAKAAAPGGHAHANLEGMRVLLAEDNDLNREIATFILQDKGINVVEAIDGQQAASLFKKKPARYFDAILMDVMMPVMDGYEATHAIRSCGKSDARTVPIIAMTANAFDDDRRKSEAAGMDMHLSKPIDGEALVGAIESMCAHTR